MPHKSALKPTGNVTLTRIPPVDTKSSYYDGTLDLFASDFFFFADSPLPSDFVYLHMDLNPRVSISRCEISGSGEHHVDRSAHSDFLLPRFISLVSSCRGIAPMLPISSMR